MCLKQASNNTIFRNSVEAVHHSSTYRCFSENMYFTVFICLANEVVAEITEIKTANRTVQLMKVTQSENS